MKTGFCKIKLLFLLCISMVSCAPPAPDEINCNTENTPFQQLYNSLVSSSGFQNVVAFDTEIHQYTFIMATSGQICSFGYQSLPTTLGLPYTIDLLDAHNKIIYSRNAVFTAGNTFYEAVGSIPIIKGQRYTLRRTILLENVGNKFTNLMGRAVIQNGSLMSFPITVGKMTITGSAFFENGEPMENAGIPFIDFGFN